LTDSWDISAPDIEDVCSPRGSSRSSTIDQDVLPGPGQHRQAATKQLLTSTLSPIDRTNKLRP
jgi:hypothetical protein